jgi:hypothetical protein
MVGVTVRRVLLNGKPVDDHVFVGAKVELLEGAKFEARNNLLYEVMISY